jgi:hypothetical protein
MAIDPTDHRTLALWAADRARRALPLFEREHPDDDRPRTAVEAARAWTRGERTVGQARTAAFAAHAAAREASSPAARAAARAAGHAAATAHVPGHAAHAAAYAATAVTGAPGAGVVPGGEPEQRLPGHLLESAYPPRGAGRRRRG